MFLRKLFVTSFLCTCPRAKLTENISEIFVYLLSMTVFQMSENSYWKANKDIK